MFEEVVAYLVLAPIAGAVLAITGWIAWSRYRRRLVPVAVEKENRATD